MDYKKLFKDKAEGKISDDMTVVFDNDGGYWSYTGAKELSEEEEEKLCEEYENKYGCPDGYGDVVDIMVGAGMNAEWC